MSKENMILNVDFISGTVFEGKGYGNCSNNGVSNRYKELYVVAPFITLQDVEKFCKENPSYKVEQFLILDYDFYNNPRYNNYCRLEPLNKGGKWNMFGGTFLYSSDSRFQLFVGGSKYPVPIHDRYEGTDMGGN